MTAPSTASPDLDAYKNAALKTLQGNIDGLQAKRQEMKAAYIDPATKYVSSQAQSRPVATAFLSIFLASFLLLLGTFFAALCFTTFAVVAGGMSLGAVRLIVVLLRAPSLPEGLKTFQGEVSRTLAIPVSVNSSSVKTDTA
ncbi:hypothetical protein RQP46_000556 [Phenoliferia psychrophenolica]